MWFSQAPIGTRLSPLKGQGKKSARDSEVAILADRFVRPRGCALSIDSARAVSEITQWIGTFRRRWLAARLQSRGTTVAFEEPGGCV